MKLQGEAIEQLIKHPGLQNYVLDEKL